MGIKGGGGGCMEKMKEPVSMLLVQIMGTGMMILSKIILNEGMSIFPLLAFRNLVGALCVAPLAFFLEREMWRKLCWMALVWIFISALFGIQLAMGLYYYGLRDTTATYSTYFLNLIPIVTFLFAVTTRIEKLGLSSNAGRMKILGTVVCVGGALMTGLYRGITLVHGDTRFGLHATAQTVAPVMTIMTRGTLFLCCSCLSYAVWFLVQVKLFAIFPSKYLATVLTCLAACIQSGVIGLILDRSKAAWKLGLNLQLLTIFYSGALNTGATFVLLSWVISRRGPTYPAMFNALTLIFTAILDCAIMGQDLTLGSLIGMVLIIVGLYTFLWGRKNEMHKSIQEKEPHMMGSIQQNITTDQYSKSTHQEESTHDEFALPHFKEEMVLQSVTAGVLALVHESTQSMQSSIAPAPSPDSTEDLSQPSMNSPSTCSSV